MDDLIRFAPAIISVVGGLIVLLFGVILRHLFNTNKLLFTKYELLDGRIKTLELAALRNDPDSTVLFQAILPGGKR